MNIRLLCISLVCFNIISYSYIHSLQPTNQEQKNQSNTVIPGASYCIYDKNDILFYGLEHSSKYVTFYTYDGNIIERREHHHDFIAVSKMLDKNASKPQPKTYIVIYWRGIHAGYNRYIGKAGLYIIFYDKNGNAIQAYPYNERKKIIKADSQDFLFVFDRPFLVDKKFPLNLENTKYYSKNHAITIHKNWVLI